MTTPSALIGTTLGTYTIQALVGSGGMATVYRGIDVHLQRPVAIKVLAANLANDPDAVARFRQEARLVASLRHPHIAQVYAFGEHAGAPYMVQELLPGPTLAQRVQDLAAQGVPMAQSDVLATIAQLASALDAAHAVGVIHRDVKPSNAISNAAGQLVLADFGIARNTIDSARNLTAAGVVMGTPGYIAPEQAIGSAALTPACDIYALGVVLFEVLAGRLPFEADTAMGVVLKHLYDRPPAPTSVRPDLPAALDAVVLQALAKEPLARFARAGDLAQALALAWPLTRAPAAPPLHSQPTDVLAPVAAGAGTRRLPAAIHNDPTRPNPVPPARRAPPAPPPPATPAPPAAAPTARATAPVTVGGQSTLIRLRSSWFLPLLLLAALVLSAVALMTLSGTGGTATVPTATVGDTLAVVPPTAVPTVTQGAATAPPATPSPAPARPTPTTIGAPALPSEPFAQFRTLLAQGVADRQIAGEARDLLDRLARVEQELANDKAADATARAGAVRQTLHALNAVDDATLVRLTQLGIPEVQHLKREVAEILPAGNLPAFLLQGLVQLNDRVVQPERVTTDLRLIFQATKQVGLFGAFLAAPALALRGYQKILALAGKDVASAFPDGPWQFSTTFGLREDAAHHCVETTGCGLAQASALDGLAAWVAAALHTLFAYDDLLANEWDERVRVSVLDAVLMEQASAQAAPPARRPTPRRWRRRWPTSAPTMVWTR